MDKHPNRRDFLKETTMAAVVAMAALPMQTRAQTRERAENKKPNFIVILADDLGRDWVGCYGSEENATPNLDALAKGGTAYQTCYSTAICTPTRRAGVGNISTGTAR